MTCELLHIWYCAPYDKQDLKVIYIFVLNLTKSHFTVYPWHLCFLHLSHVLVDGQGDEISNLKRQLMDTIKASENAHVDRADTINRLSRSVEDSQRQCQELLVAGKCTVLLPW